MIARQPLQSQRMAWLEGIRFFAAVMILLYHSQADFTHFAYTPQPTGLVDNLKRLTEASSSPAALGLITSFFKVPVWFGAHFVDVFVLMSGFTLALSLRGKPLETGSFLKRRLLRLLWPFWTVAWLSYPILWSVGAVTHSYMPDSWHSFAGAIFPLTSDFRGTLLLPTSGPWWFVPLIFSLTLVFPFLWKLMQRWGAGNLLLLSLILTLAYRALATYKLGGHPTYIILDTPAAEQPFQLFLAKLSTFVVGMVVAQAYSQGKGPIFWNQKRSLLWGVLLYGLGFVCQFYRLGWVLVDLLLPLGLTLLCMVLFRFLSSFRSIEALMLPLGACSYSYFLIHNFVVDRTLNLVVHDSLVLYSLMLPVMIMGTLLLAVLADYTRPLIEKLVTGLLSDIDYVLTQSHITVVRTWTPAAGERVRYRGNSGWTVLKVEKLLDEKEFYLCRIAKCDQTLWVPESDLQLAELK